MCLVSFTRGWRTRTGVEKEKQVLLNLKERNVCERKTRISFFLLGSSQRKGTREMMKEEDEVSFREGWLGFVLAKICCC